MKILYPNIDYVDIGLYILIPMLWFALLWTIYIFIGRCECGAFYHTKEDKKAFLKFVYFSILSSLLISMVLYFLHII
jgi:hypothetical protein